MFRASLALSLEDAIARHKRPGQSIYGVQDGRIVEIPASKIRVPRLR